MYANTIIGLCPIMKSSTSGNQKNHVKYENCALESTIAILELVSYKTKVQDNLVGSFFKSPNVKVFCQSYSLFKCTGVLRAAAFDARVF